tara:strand:+ start:391 stop:741 length:351 start_codon:yes stop_codon:yes gene_type:complete
MSCFKNKFDFEKRLEESTRIIEKYPDRIPIIVERSEKCTEIKDIDKNKFLVPKDLTCSQFYYIIRKRLNVNQEQALFFFCDNILHSNNTIIDTVYNNSKNEDGFLYFIYSAENTFG